MSEMENFLSRTANFIRKYRSAHVTFKGMFIPGGVKFSSNKEQAVMRERVRSAKLGRPFKENKNDNIEEIDQKVIEQMVDDWLEENI